MATITITEHGAPNAGTNGTLTVCEGSTPTEEELFAQLGGNPDTGGTWSNAGLVYTYTVNATTPCTENASATVTVTQTTIGGTVFWQVSGLTGTGAQGVITYPAKGPETCRETKPSEPPILLGGEGVGAKEILLKIFPAAEPVTHYSVEYGLLPGIYIYGAENIGKPDIDYTVSALKPSTEYFFRVKAANGCATTGWSNEVSAKTSAFVSSIQKIVSTL